MVRAQAGSCVGRAGRQTKIFRRLAVSPRPLALYGPPTISLLISSAVPMTSNRFSRAPFNLRSTGVGIWAAPPRRRPRARRRVAFGLQVLARRGDADGVQPGLHGNAHLIRIGLRLFAVGLHAENPDLEDVLAVERKIVRDGDAGARVERQLVAQSLVAAAFERIALRVVDLLDRLHRQIADGQTAHLGAPPTDTDRAMRATSTAPPRCCRSRSRNRRPAAIRRADVDGQQIADGVAVLGAIQTMHRRAAGIRMSGRRAVQRGLEIGRERSGQPGHPGARERSRAASRPSAACAPPSPRPGRGPERSPGRGSEARDQPSSACRCGRSTQ